MWVSLVRALVVGKRLSWVRARCWSGLSLVLGGPGGVVFQTSLRLPVLEAGAVAVGAVDVGVVVVDAGPGGGRAQEVGGLRVQEEWRTLWEVVVEGAVGV